MPSQYASELLSGPASEPITLREARDACDISDNFRDSELSLWITEARKIVEHDSRLSLVNQSFAMYLHSFPSRSFFELPVSPLSSVTSITYLDTAGSSQTLSTDVYKIDTARKPPRVWLKHNQTWPATYTEANAVTVTYVAGHGATSADVPEMAKQAIKFVVRHRMENPDMYAPGVQFEMPETYHCLVRRLHPGDYP